jgi:hypothetical protein
LTCQRSVIEVVTPNKVPSAPSLPSAPVAPSHISKDSTIGSSTLNLLSPFKSLKSVIFLQSPVVSENRPIEIPSSGTVQELNIKTKTAPVKKLLSIN